LALLYTIRRLVRRHDAPRTDRLVRRATIGLLLLSFAALTLCEVLRWIVAGRAPVANGYETMLLIAWFTLLFAFVAGRRFPIALPFGALISGFFLLVSHLALMDPRITPLMPVLGSPLLSLHVSVIMMAYALLSLTFICALTALLLAAIGRRDPERTAERMGAIERGMAGLGFSRALRLEQAQNDLLNARSPQEQEQARQRLNLLAGNAAARENPKDNYTTLTGPNGEQTLVDLRTQRVVSPRYESIDQDPRAQAIRGDAGLSREQKEARLRALGYA